MRSLRDSSTPSTPSPRRAAPPSSRWSFLGAFITALVVAPSAFAQPAPAPAGGDGESPAPGNGVTVIQIPPANAAQQYPGNLPPPGFNPDAHLNSSSRTVTDTSRSSDGFDFNYANGGGDKSVRGGANGQYVHEGGFVPEAHAVRRRETLWEISSRYFNNPYQWPRIWSYNPQIQNPHWIYPGDRVRLRDPNGATARVGLHTRGVPPKTVFLRNYGWVDDRKDDTWGELLGSPSDRMMLTDGDDVYIKLADDHDVSVGDELTIFRTVKTVESANASGELVSIRGTAKIERYNPKTHMVRAKIIESLDVIERGCKVGPVGRKFDVVPPVNSDIDLEASILAAVYPYHFYGQNQVVFIDRGEKEGVRPGMRFFAVGRGDRWDKDIDKAGQLAIVRPRVEDDLPSKYDTLPTGQTDDDQLPDETFAELRVMRVREHTATAIVVGSKHEVERNVRLVARKGF